MNTQKKWFLPIFVLFLIRCGGSEVGNPEFFETNLRIVGYDSIANARKSVRALSDGNVLSEARLVLSEVRFVSGTDCSVEEANETAEFDFPGPYVVDLLANSSIPDITETKIPKGTYCRIKMKLDKLEANEIPSGIEAGDSIVEKSLLVQGERNDGTPFTITLEIDDEFELRNRLAGFAIGDSASPKDFFVAFDLGKWFEGVDLSTADVSSGEIYIDKDNNKDLFEQYVSNVKLSSKLFEDANDDGDLGEEEADAEDELGEGEDL